MTTILIPSPNENGNKHWYAIIALGATIAILLMLLTRQCNETERVITGKDINQPQLVKTDTFWKTAVNEKWHEPKVIVKWRVDTVHHYVPAKIDTEAVILDYFTDYRYRDTLRDSNIVIANDIYVSENGVVKDSSRITYKLLREKIIDNTYNAPPRIFISAGGSVGFNQHNLFLGPELLLTDKHRRSYGVGYDIINRTYSAKIYFKIIGK